MKIYSDIKSKKTYCERWGASTKHPDASFCYDNHVTSDWVERNSVWDIYAWLMETAVDTAFVPRIASNIEYVNRLMRQYVNDEHDWELIVSGL